MCDFFIIIVFYNNYCYFVLIDRTDGGPVLDIVAIYVRGLIYELGNRCGFRFKRMVNFMKKIVIHGLILFNI